MYRLLIIFRTLIYFYLMMTDVQLHLTLMCHVGAIYNNGANVMHLLVVSWHFGEGTLMLFWFHGNSYCSLYVFAYILNAVLIFFTSFWDVKHVMAQRELLGLCIIGICTGFYILFCGDAAFWKYTSTK